MSDEEKRAPALKEGAGGMGSAAAKSKVDAPAEDVDETLAGGLDYPDPIRSTKPPKGLSHENAPMEDGDDERKNSGSIQDE